MARAFHGAAAGGARSRGHELRLWPGGADADGRLVLVITSIATTPAGRYLFQAYVTEGTSRNWTFRHAVDMRLANPAGIRLTVDGTNPLPPGTTAPITLRIGRHGKIAQTG